MYLEFYAAYWPLFFNHLQLFVHLPVSLLFLLSLLLDSLSLPAPPLFRSLPPLLVFSLLLLTLTHIKQMCLHIRMCIFGLQSLEAVIRTVFAWTEALNRATNQNRAHLPILIMAKNLGSGQGVEIQCLCISKKCLVEVLFLPICICIFYYSL